MEGRHTARRALAAEAIHGACAVEGAGWLCGTRFRRPTAATACCSAPMDLRDPAHDHSARSGPGPSDHLLLVFTGISRLARKSLKRSLRTCRERRRIMRCRAGEFGDHRALVADGRPSHFGRLLGESWKRKRQLSDSVSNRRSTRQATGDAGANRRKLLAPAVAGSSCCLSGRIANVSVCRSALVAVPLHSVDRLPHRVISRTVSSITVRSPARGMLVIV